MAKLVDPDDLEQGLSVIITPGTSGTIGLKPGYGNLVWHDGVTEQCVYSFLKEEWKDDPDLIRYPFPMIAITEESMELTNSWNWADVKTKRHIRDGGWALKSTGGDSKEEYANITTLGTFNANTDRGYYVQSDPTSSGSPSGFYFRDEVNEAVQIFGVHKHWETGPTNLTPASGVGLTADYRDDFVAYLREQADSYGRYDLLTEQNISTLTYKKYAMPLASSSDPKITGAATDAAIAAGGAWANVDISYHRENQVKSIGGVDYSFHIIIEGDGQTNEVIYEKVQYLLRSEFNINELYGAGGPKIRGDIAKELLYFTGDVLTTNFVEGWGGTYIDNYHVDDTNELEFYDDTNTKRVEPFAATGSLLFNDNIKNDTDAKYWMFFTDANGNNYGDSDAIVVRDTSDLPISGSVGGASSVAYTFAYDTNVQGGRVKATDADITVVVIGLEIAQFVKNDTVTITKTTGINVSMVAALERNYSNP